MNDLNPNVVVAALSTPQEAVRALRSDHYGLLYEAAHKLKGWDEGKTAVPALLGALQRVSAEKRANSHDPRTEMLQRIREFGTAEDSAALRPLLFDVDPAIAKLASDIIAEKTGVRVDPGTKRYDTKVPPPASYILALDGATATIHMKEAGSYTVALLPDVAPVTVATFAQLADRGYYNGLTMHRIVPNFVIQGGSPGASEYVGYPDFMRDELGLESHLRGTLGISTRGRDTGDAQFFVNLVDNFRLDHGYTVFARVIAGMDAVDNVQEGDVIESIEIHRKP
jgi:cyclophilin family peptidyl-prolyl cis-trans isomerase